MGYATSSVGVTLKGSKPREAGSTILNAFCRASSNLRPTAITSPTDFMEEPILVLTRVNLPRSQRGIWREQGEEGEGGEGGEGQRGRGGEGKWGRGGENYEVISTFPTYTVYT